MIYAKPLKSRDFDLFMSKAYFGLPGNSVSFSLLSHGNVKFGLFILNAGGIYHVNVFHYHPPMLPSQPRPPSRSLHLRFRSAPKE